MRTRTTKIIKRMIDDYGYNFYLVVSEMHTDVEKKVLIFALGFDASALIARFIEREIKATEELVLMSDMKRILIK